MFDMHRLTQIKKKILLFNDDEIINQQLENDI